MIHDEVHETLGVKRPLRAEREGLDTECLRMMMMIIIMPVRPSDDATAPATGAVLATTLAASSRACVLAGLALRRSNVWRFVI